MQFAGSETTRLVTVHCTATPNGLHVDLGAMKADHIARGFGDIGYHAVIQPDGSRIQTRSITDKGCHVAGHNTGNVGICLVGLDMFHVEQFNSLRELLHTYELAFGWKPWDLLCHYEFDTARQQGKTCPSIRNGDLMAWFLLDKEEIISKYLL